MSTAARLISGSLSSWLRIAVSMLTQIALVPLYLTHWNVRVYGVWIAIQSLLSVLGTLDTGHQTFLGYEFLKIGKSDLKKVSLYLCSGAVVGVALGLLQVILIIVFVVGALLPKILGESHLSDQILISQAGYALLFQGISWLLCSSVGGLFGRVLYLFGYYPRMSWWGVLAAVVSGAAPAFAVVYGANLLMAGLVLSISTVLFNIPLFIDMFRLFRKEGLRYTTPSIGLGFRNFVLSLALSGKGILENARQQGTRLILVPMVGTAGLAAFSTMRTGANVALQGLNTIVGPLEPELMRFLHQRDQERIEAAFGTVWVVVVAFLAPAVLIVQIFVGPVYEIWTRGQIHFNPWLFAMLSQAVLVYAVAQPAMSVMIGNNLLRPQLLLSALAATIVIVGIVAMVPFSGITGAGLALLLAEVGSTTGYRLVTKKWLKNNGLFWPRKSSIIAITSVWLAGVGMVMMILLPQFKWFVFVVFLLLLFFNCVRYWRSMPYIVTETSKRLLGKIPGVKYFFKN